MTGTALKDAALDLLERKRKHIIAKARIAFADSLLNNGYACADDAHKAFPDGFPAGINPVCLGAVPRIFTACNAIKLDGYIQNNRPGIHARPIANWALVSGDKVARIREELLNVVDDEMDDDGQPGLFD